MFSKKKRRRSGGEGGGGCGGCIYLLIEGPVNRIGSSQGFSLVQTLHKSVNLQKSQQNQFELKRKVTGRTVVVKYRYSSGQEESGLKKRAADGVVSGRILKTLHTDERTRS